MSSAHDQDFLDDDDEPATDEEWAYNECLQDEDWISTRKLAVNGTIFRHSKHPEDVHPGVQHKLFVWLCETKRPHEHCPCGLYTLTWLDA